MNLSYYEGQGLFVVHEGTLGKNMSQVSYSCFFIGPSSNIFSLCGPLHFSLGHFLILSLPRGINFKFLLQTHQKYNIIQYGELGLYCSLFR